jgi:hypothetical protein
MTFLLGLLLLTSPLLAQNASASHSTLALQPQKHSQDATHLAVCKDAVFEKSDQATLPTGVLRIFEQQLSMVTLTSLPKTSRARVAADSFLQGKTTAKEIEGALGTPVCRLKITGKEPLFGVDSNKHIFATTGAIVVFVFDSTGILSNTHAYIVAPK